MTATTPIAIDECAAIMVQAALAHPTAVVRWTGKEDNNPPEARVPWFRYTMTHTDGGQASLAGDQGARRWGRVGLIIVQCFAPMDQGGMTLAQRMAESVRDAYQGQATPSGVWFRNVTTNEIGRDGPWYQVNAVIHFTYDEVR